LKFVHQMLGLTLTVALVLKIPVLQFGSQSTVLYVLHSL